MSPLWFSILVWASTIVCALLGMALHVRLAERHLSENARDVVKLVIALVATMSALVLGLLISSANTSYDRQISQLKALSANVILFDRTLDLYGPDAKPVRDHLRAVVHDIHDRVWGKTGIQLDDLASLQTLDSIKTNAELLYGLVPKTNFQRSMLTNAMQQGEALAEARLMMFEARGGSIAGPFLIILVFWICVLFVGFGLLARCNATVMVSLVLGGMSVAGAIFLILEMSSPYSGVMKMSDEPLLRAIDVIDK